jgi:hypothetical protein
VQVRPTGKEQRDPPHAPAAPVDVGQDEEDGEGKQREAFGARVEQREQHRQRQDPGAQHLPRLFVPAADDQRQHRDADENPVRDRQQGQSTGDDRAVEEEAGKPLLVEPLAPVRKRLKRIAVGHAVVRGIPPRGEQPVHVAVGVTVQVDGERCRREDEGGGD